MKYTLGAASENFQKDILNANGAWVAQQAGGRSGAHNVSFIVQVLSGVMHFESGAPATLDSPYVVGNPDGSAFLHVSFHDLDNLHLAGDGATEIRFTPTQANGLKVYGGGNPLPPTNPPTDYDFELGYDENGAPIIRSCIWDEDAQSVVCTFQNPTTNATVPAPAEFHEDKDVEIVPYCYEAVAAGAGYAVGDEIKKMDFVNTSPTPPVSVGEVWVNITQGGANIAAPPAGDIRPCRKADFEVEQVCDVEEKNIKVTTSGAPAGSVLPLTTNESSTDDPVVRIDIDWGDGTTDTQTASGLINHDYAGLGAATYIVQVVFVTTSGNEFAETVQVVFDGTAITTATHSGGQAPVYNVALACVRAHVLLDGTVDGLYVPGTATAYTAAGDIGKCPAVFKVERQNSQPAPPQSEDLEHRLRFTVKTAIPAVAPYPALAVGDRVWVRNEYDFSGTLLGQHWENEYGQPVAPIPAADLLPDGENMVVLEQQLVLPRVPAGGPEGPQGLTPPAGVNVRYAVLQFEAHPQLIADAYDSNNEHALLRDFARYTVDGTTAPSVLTNFGFRAGDTTTVLLRGDEIANFMVLDRTDTAAPYINEVHVAYYIGDLPTQR